MKRLASSVLLGALSALFLSSPLSAQGVTRISVDAFGVEGNAASTRSSISADGQILAYQSSASNLVAGDTNSQSDIFVLDRATGIPIRVSVDSFGVEANGLSEYPDIAQGGQFVAFSSHATNLVPNDTNSASDIFVHDLSTGVTTRVSVDSSGIEGNGDSIRCSISSDGRYVVYESEAVNLVASDTNGVGDIFLHDRQTAVTTMVSVDSIGVQGNGLCQRPAISANGLVIAFMSASTNLVSGDTNSRTDIFVHEHLGGQTTRVSVKSGGNESSGRCNDPELSSDGMVVVFTSDAFNIAPGNRNSGQDDVYIHDRATASTSRVSVNSQGVAGVQWSRNGALSADGRYVVFESWSNDLITQDFNLMTDVFLHDRALGRTKNLSYSMVTVQGNRGSASPVISADGDVILFDNFAANLVMNDTNGVDDIFINDRSAYPNFSKSGTCPGPVRMQISNLTSGGRVALLYGTHGIFVQTGQPCNGLQLGILAPNVGAIFTADALGEVSFTLNSLSAQCWSSMQAVDLTSCKASNRLIL